MSFTVTVTGASPSQLKQNLAAILDYMIETNIDPTVLPFKSAVAAPKPTELKEEDSAPTVVSEKPIEIETTSKRTRRTKAQIEADDAKEAAAKGLPAPTIWPTKTEVTQLVIKLNSAKGIEACRVVLGKVGAQQMSQVSEDKYVELKKLCEAELASVTNAAESVL